MKRKRKIASPQGCAASTGSAVVFRVQDREGRGPWKPGFSDRWVEDRTDEEFAALCPFPLGVMLSLRAAAGRRHMGYACETLDQLRRWFRPGEYQTLLRFGYRAVKLDVDNVLARSDSQCCFVRSRPLRVGGERFDLYPQNANSAGDPPTIDSTEANQ